MLPPASSLAEAAAGLAAAAEQVAGTVWRPDGLCREEADRKCLPSQSSPQWRQVVVGSAEGAGTEPEGAALSPAAAAAAAARPGRGSYSSAGGPPGQTPDAPSPSAAQRSQPPALPSPPPGCLSPVGRERTAAKQRKKDTGAKRQVKCRGMQTKEGVRMEEGKRCAAERKDGEVRYTEVLLQ